MVFCMKCYYVLVHGQLDWSAASPPTSDDDSEIVQLRGFYCHRYVLASSVYDAQKAAFLRVRENLDRQTGWITSRGVKLEMEVEEIATAPIYYLLKPDNRGHTFYEQE